MTFAALDNLLVDRVDFGERVITHVAGKVDGTPSFPVVTRNVRCRIDGLRGRAIRLPHGVSESATHKMYIGAPQTLAQHHICTAVAGVYKDTYWKVDLVDKRHGDHYAVFLILDEEEKDKAALAVP